MKINYDTINFFKSLYWDYQVSQENIIIDAAKERATNNGEPTGAIATFMSSKSQSWNPPMDAQD